MPDSPSPVPARDDAPDDVVWTTQPDDPNEYGHTWDTREEADVWARTATDEFDNPTRVVPLLRVPSPDVLRAECEALTNAIEDCTESLGDPDAPLGTYEAHLATLTRMLDERRALLAAVTRDDAGEER
jgi:hypothetical protein